VNCYVLVGGLSRRMGRSKVDLPFAGSTFLDLVVEVAGAVFEDVVLVGQSRIPGFRMVIEPAHDRVAPVYGVLSALADSERSPGFGRSSEAAAEAGAPFGKVFILAVDYPLMTTEMLRFLRVSFEKTLAPMLVPMWRERPQMLCAGYSASLLPVLQKREAAGRLDLRGLIEEAGAEMIPESVLRQRFSGEPLMNVNTPEELEEARKRHGR
jgi:molybdopterin-guanine dinucleotide biosynthesis protein A